MSKHAFVTMSSTLGGKPMRRSLMQEVLAELSKPENKHVLALVDDETGDVHTFMNPVPYFAKNDASAVTRGRAVAAEDDGDSSTEARQSMAEDLEALSNRVVELFDQVSRTAEGSVERGRAEADLIAAKRDLLTGLRTCASELEAALGALAKPSVAREQIEDDLSAVRELLEGLETDRQGASKNSRTDDDGDEEAFLPPKPHWKK